MQDSSIGLATVTSNINLLKARWDKYMSAWETYQSEQGSVTDAEFDAMQENTAITK